MCLWPLPSGLHPVTIAYRLLRRGVEHTAPPNLEWNNFSLIWNSNKTQLNTPSNKKNDKLIVMNFQFTYNMCGYLSVSFTEISVNFMFRYWSTECSVPHMLWTKTIKYIKEIELIAIHWDGLNSVCTIRVRNTILYLFKYLKSFFSSTTTSFPTNDLKNE